MEDNGQEGCTTHTIARSAVGHVDVCPHCRSVQLTLEYLTLRLQPAAFRELAVLLGAALARLEPPLRQPASPAVGDGKSPKSVH